jgi:Pyridine nucleotide-disulphide oxidoreductase
MHQALPRAKSVLVAGGRPVGMETAGEIISKYPNLKVTLASGSDRVLPLLSASTSSKAQKMLKKGVEVIHNKKIKWRHGSSASATTVSFGDGSRRLYDVYLHAIGGRPNTGFLPTSWLDERKFIPMAKTQFVPIDFGLALCSLCHLTIGCFHDNWCLLVSSKTYVKLRYTLARRLLLVYIYPIMLG